MWNFLHLHSFLHSIQNALKGLSQGSPDTVLEGRCPAEFSSNPNQTHLKQLINVLQDILATSMQVCWSKLELNSAGHQPPGPSLVTPGLSSPSVQTYLDFLQSEAHSFHFWCERAFTFTKYTTFNIKNKQASPAQMRKSKSNVTHYFP